MSREEEEILNASLVEIDSFAYEQARLAELYAIYPGREENSRRYRMFVNGWYVPEGHSLPMGDNRDNSRDGRYFGPVPDQDVLGRASLLYWPMQRFRTLADK